MPKTAVVENLAPKSPSFKDYRRLNDAYMVPDRGFVKQLKMLDEEFEVVWDWGANKWEIWKFPKGFGEEPYHVTTVQTKGRGYRETGADLLLKLQEANYWKRGFTVNQLANYLEELDNQVRRRKAKDFANRIEAIALETFSYAQGILQVQVPRSLRIGEVVKSG